MVLSHATEEGAGDATKATSVAAAQSKSLMTSLKGLMAKQTSKAAA
jgi:hypothetical protein